VCRLRGKRPECRRAREPTDVELNGAERYEPGDRHHDQGTDDEKREAPLQKPAAGDPRRERDRPDTEVQRAGDQRTHEPRVQGRLDRLRVGARFGGRDRGELHRGEHGEEGAPDHHERDAERAPALLSLLAQQRSKREEGQEHEPAPIPTSMSAMPERSDPPSRPQRPPPYRSDRRYAGDRDTPRGARRQGAVLRG
jgi:hypothetical protein